MDVKAALPQKLVSSPSSRVEISVSCRNLRDKDVFSKSDPLCVLKMKSLGSNTFQEVDRTEMIKDTLNPSFVKHFVVDYFFEEMQKLRFELYDVDSSDTTLSHHDFLGWMECNLGEVISSPGGTFDKKLFNRSNVSGKNGTIFVHAEELKASKEIITLKFRGVNLDKKDFFGKSDPFLTISRINPDNSYSVCHKTEVIKKTLNPVWRPFTISATSLCNAVYERPIKIECFDWNSSGTHDFIGSFDTTFTELIQGHSQKLSFQLVNLAKKSKKKSHKSSGEIILDHCAVETQHTFIDYIQGGMQINCTVAIDFTASNGIPSHPQSLHYINPYEPNLYARAITSVGSIIQDYDSDKMFPVLGFGAKFPQTGQVSHEFFVNGNPNDPFVHGVQGIYDAYYSCLKRVELYGPTNFSPVINHVARFASQCQDGSNYYILLILTDGVITDMAATKDAIVRASTLPISIIIVGIGDAEFDSMDELDADNKRLYYNGTYAARDIVQFVPFRDFIGHGKGNLQLSQELLAKEVLAEVPTQVVEYMKSRQIKPRMPPTVPALNVIQSDDKPTAAASNHCLPPPFVPS